MHKITGSKPEVLKVLKQAVDTVQQDGAVLQAQMQKVLQPKSEAERQQLRDQMLGDLKAAYYDEIHAETDSHAEWFASRQPLVGLTQSAMNSVLQQENIAGAPAAGVPRFGPADPGWIECLIDGWKTLQEGKAEFTTHSDLSQFVTDIPDKCQIALVSDWGAANDPAAEVAGQILRAKPDYIVHLGDIYYAGQDDESDQFLDLWRSCEGVKGKSFALNGNHEMFSGGRGYFGKVLPAFGQQASYFGLQNTYWQLLGMDTAYVDHRLISPDDAAIDARLVKQWDWLVDKIRNNSAKASILMSHHQPLSAYQDDHAAGGNLRNDLQKLYSAIGGKYLYGWLFGHEHRCTIYDDHSTEFKARLIGNGCIPHLPPREVQPDTGCIPFVQMNRSTRSDNSGDAISGFALVSLDGPQIDIKYINEDGSSFYSETWSRAVPPTRYF